MKYVVMLSALLLGGCVYNPYTGLWQPAGYYPYGYYPYGYYRPYGYAPPQGGWQGSASNQSGYHAAPLPPPSGQPQGTQQPTRLAP